MSPADSQTQPLLDRGQIEMLIQAAGPEAPALLLQLLGLFRDDVQGRVAQLSELAQVRQWREMARHAHAIAGASANLGGYRLTFLCRAVEKILIMGDPEEVHPWLPLLAECYEATIQGLQDAIDDLQRPAGV